MFTDGFSITDPVLSLSAFVTFLKEECGINIYSSKRTWQNKASKDLPKRFFIRMDDKSSVITPKFLVKLAKAMRKYREHLRQCLFKKLIEKKKTRNVMLTDEETRLIEQSVHGVFIQKFDDT